MTVDTAEGVLEVARSPDSARCPVRAMEAWLRASDCQYGPVFRKVDRWGTVERTALHPYALPKLLVSPARATWPG